jgi:hypothetical protein
MKRAAGAQQRDQTRDDIRTDESTGALLSLRPRVREENTNRGERVGWNTAEEIDHIAVDDANVAEPAALDCFEHGGHSGGVHVNADDVLARARRGDFDKGLATTETNVEDHVAGGAEHVLERKLIAIDREPPPLQSPGVGNDSRRREASAARLERPLRRMRHDEWNRHGTMMVPPPNVQG